MENENIQDSNINHVKSNNKRKGLALNNENVKKKRGRPTKAESELLKEINRSIVHVMILNLVK